MDDLINVFGKIVKESRDSSLDIVSDYKKEDYPKTPIESQIALINLIKSLDDEQFNQLQKGLKYCIEHSLFVLISNMESGVGEYSFNLSIREEDKKIEIISDDEYGDDNDLIHKFWDWMN